ncbi:MAG: hypothetical protein FWC10_10335 [Lentimicrobiaceae bacterium]|nr:hypothetical protein [Lentimicrobiaceae bacterium]
MRQHEGEQSKKKRRKSRYTVERRIADERFIFTGPGIDYQIGDEYYVLLLDSAVMGWARTETGAWSLCY